jgi:hypothetical protein
MAPASGATAASSSNAERPSSQDARSLNNPSAQGGYWRRLLCVLPPIVADGEECARRAQPPQRRNSADSDVAMHATRARWLPKTRREPCTLVIAPDGKAYALPHLAPSPFTRAPADVRKSYQDPQAWKKPGPGLKKGNTANVAVSVVRARRWPKTP